MDKNTIIGLVLIFGIIFGFSWLNKPSEEQQRAMQQQRDSIAMVQEMQRSEAIELEKARESASVENNITDSTQNAATFGYFAAATQGNNDTTTIETNLLRLRFANKGGRIISAELKEYNTYDSLPLILFDENEATSNYILITSDNRVINTQDLYFTPILSETPEAKSLTMRLSIDTTSYIDFTYNIPTDNYMTTMSVKAVNMTSYLDARYNSLEMSFTTKIRQQEKGRSFEERYANLYYKYTTDDVDKLSESSNSQESLTGMVRWVAFKDHFFSTIHIADASFSAVSVESKVMPSTSEYIKEYKMRANLEFDPTGVKPTVMQTYYGPNKYKTLASYDDNLEGDMQLQLEEIIPLGWSLFRAVSVYLIIPMFNFFGSFISNYGLVILILTIVIKLILLPFTYKSYMSTAKMRVLKPQIDEINERIPAEKAMERQQATMALYKKLGVSPMSGCLPMLLQMPILFAMFSFFPTAIELRQESFLWAEDLSSYDAILSWDFNIPLISSTFGNHISLFCLLMTITNIIYTKINMSNNAGNSQMASMKWIMYLMPLMFLFMFNNYASGLSYYYFVSLLITIGQTYLFRLFIDEKKLLARLEANKNKPQKKSGFMARLEAAQKAQQAEMRKRSQQKR